MDNKILLLSEVISLSAESDQEKNISQQVKLIRKENYSDDVKLRALEDFLIQNATNILLSDWNNSLKKDDRLYISQKAGIKTYQDFLFKMIDMGYALDRLSPCGGPDQQGSKSGMIMVPMWLENMARVKSGLADPLTTSRWYLSVLYDPLPIPSNIISVTDKNQWTRILGGIARYGSISSFWSENPLDNIAKIQTFKKPFFSKVSDIYQIAKINPFLACSILLAHECFLSAILITMARKSSMAQSDGYVGFRGCQLVQNQDGKIGISPGFIAGFLAECEVGQWYNPTDTAFSEMLFLKKCGWEIQIFKQNNIPIAILPLETQETVKMVIQGNEIPSIRSSPYDFHSEFTKITSINNNFIKNTTKIFENM